MTTQASHDFGGDWTTEKLNRIREYLKAYTTIFNSNPGARMLETIYVDAFAGTGYRTRDPIPEEQSTFLEELTSDETQNFLKGSARIALEVEPSFKRYLFIEKRPKHIRELEQLKSEFLAKASRIHIERAEANAYLTDWCKTTDWRRSRAVVFLDPYGMQVKWPLIQAIAATHAIDLWILFPLGMGVSRLLTRSEPPPQYWAQLLTGLLGTDDWRQAFYPMRRDLTLFGEEESQTREANFNQIGRYFVQRLKTIFPAVADNPLALVNSKNVPLYLLCFAAGNPKGAPTALKIAQSILEK
jgi:three-Cys-motif partner protein